MSVYPVAVLNAAFCMTCSLLMLVEDARGDHMEDSIGIFQSQYHDSPVGSHKYLHCTRMFIYIGYWTLNML